MVGSDNLYEGKYSFYTATATATTITSMMMAMISSRRGGWHCHCVLSIVMVLSVTGGCSGIQHVVGDDKGWSWDSSSDPIRFNQWAANKVFRVGDNLWFAYSSGSQNVVEVKSHDEWASCNVSNPIRLYNAGVDSVPLLDVGTRYFTSGMMEDCLHNGMKLHINVLPLNADVQLHSHSHLTAQAPTSSASSISLCGFFIFNCLILSLSLFLSPP